MSAPVVDARTNGRPAAIDLQAVLGGQRSRLLDYLPAVFSAGEDGDFLGRYLMVFETIIDEIDEVVSGIADRFDPSVAPEPFLPWLASWIGLVLDDGWPLARRRAVLARSTDLHRWRGTVRGLREHLQLYTGYKPEIDERGGSLTLGRRTHLGEQTVLGQADRPYHFTVVLRVPNPGDFDRARLRTIVEAQRPAHTTYSLFVLPGPGEPVDPTAASGERTGGRADGGNRP
jgi:phage tail-like protein